MINVSNEYRKLIYSDDRNFIVTVKMRLADGTKLTIHNNRIMENGIQFDDAVGEDSTFSAVGSVIINSFTLVLNNIYEDFSDYDFTDAVITSIKFALVLSDGTVETLNKAIATNEDTEEVYTVDDTSYNGATITLTCLDNMSKFDKPYSTSNLNYPTRLDNIIINACQQCGVTLAASSTTFPKYDFIVANKPSQETTSFREVISWCATIAGCFARCNTHGELELKWFDTEPFEDEDTNDFDGGIFDSTNLVTKDKMISAQETNHGVTAFYEGNGWWHITGERDTDSQFTLWLYNDILAEYGNSVIINSITDGSTLLQTSVCAQYSTAEGRIASNHSIQPNKSQTATVYNLTKIGLIFNRCSGTEPLPAFDTRIKFTVNYADESPLYKSGDVLNGGLFNPWEVVDEADGGLFTDNTVLNISSLYSQDIGTDDIVITKVSCNIKSEEELTQAQIDAGIVSANGIVSYSKGINGYEIVVENNEFITASNIKTIVDYLGDQLIGLRFRRVNVTHLSDPTMEAGDIAYVWDRKNNRYQILITRTAFSISSSQTTVCGASTPLRNSAKRFSEATKSYVELRKQIQVVQNPYAKALSDLASAMQQANGLYTTEVTQPDGSVITYKHNMPNLSESNIQMAITDVGATFTTNGTDNDPTWYGFTMDGRVVASILNAAGVNANWIRSGQLIVEDSQGNETFFADYATGVVRINATSFSVKVSGTNQTIQNIADNAAQNAATSAQNAAKTYTDDELASTRAELNTSIGNTKNELNDAISNLQKQVDGQIDMYYEEHEPSTSNLPASQWIADGEEADHEGDVFCNINTGYSYRWFRTNGVWGWNQIADTDVQTAIANARDAYNLASDKKRVFINTPVPPYDSGDLWVQGNTGDIMRCKFGRSIGDAYSIDTDWEKASKYTDDTAVDNLQIGARNLLKESDIVNKHLTVEGLTLDYEGEGWWHVYGTTSTRYGNYVTLYSNADGLFSDDGNVTVSADFEGLAIDPGNSYLSYFVAIDGGVGATMSITQNTRYERSFVFTSESLRDFRYNVQTNGFTCDGRFRIKIERGNRATDYTPAPEDVTAAIKDLETVLETQIDGKVQTWVSAFDPSTNWTADQKETNVGDLWYYTGESIQNSYQNNCVYQYEQNSQTGVYGWNPNPYSTSSDLFDAIDGKTTIYYGRPEDDGEHTPVILPPTYTLEKGDYLVDPLDGKTYRWDSDNSKWINVTDYQSTLNNWIHGSYAEEIINLRTLIADSKIETWYQPTNPADDSWALDHKGDIWYCSSTTDEYAQKTWQWNGSKWEEMKSTPPKEVFDQIDGKAHIYIGTDEPTDMAEGDLWFRSADDPILTYVENGIENGEWVEYNKYTDDTVANAVGEEVRKVERTLSAEIKSLGDSVDISITETNENLEEIKTHYRFDENGETIGKTDSLKSIKLSNDGIDMLVNNESVTHWNQDEMYTPTRVRVPVGGSLQLGDFIFQPRSNGNISLLFIGED